jgi:hypothetical protein
MNKYNKNYFQDDAVAEFQPEIERIKNTIQLFIDSKLEMPFSFEIKWDYSTDIMNAKVSKDNPSEIDDDSYTIIINASIPLNMARTFHRKLLQMDDVIMRKIPDPEEEGEFLEVTDREYYVHAYVSRVLAYVIWHEIGHIVLGHCTIPNSHQWNELTNQNSGSIMHQQMELLCDLFSIQYSEAGAMIALKEKSDTTYIAHVFALLHAFLQELENVLHETNASINPIGENRTHPHPAFRLKYILQGLKVVSGYYAELSERDIEAIESEYNRLLREMGYSGIGIVNPDDSIYSDYKGKLLNRDAINHLSSIPPKRYYEIRL